ncbi:flagellar biosynthesis anti-sigma factor FlgM [Fervidobacterium pennivorans DSM 9078]|uniref:Negative regulator of flagellin synthesis n=2 Tax=Fervidobacterium pennivorans TaxID=93466 RepID=H9UET8_FERPD|nr:flagellar biosynthesis anti-sigma factor FlgM [Fervidobacterium pennivorans]AFG36031.1 flagellar biosynthesis anti-sigma factor FlgM [Fervidobacterium pennivorans DSM 9078]QIV79365.1 flagellar biosynthesis anti-sigma factor FlgM [Fervidobacterium pennivorans subsp. keratinolyticus]
MIDKINKVGIHSAQNVQEVKGKTEKNVEKSKVKGEAKNVADSIILEEGKKVAEYIEMAKNYPEIRVELVNQIKQAIENGTFKVDVEKIAKKILEG